MPTGQLRSGSHIEATTLVLDTWANVENEELQVHWDIELPNEQRELLGLLVEQMNYLGRSESWTVGRLFPAQEHPKAPNVTLHHAGAPLDRNEELVNLTAPVAAGAYAQWRAERVPALVASGRKPTAKQLKEQEKTESAYPADLFTALQWDSKKWQAGGWIQPPGSRVLQYRRDRDTLSVNALPRSALASRHESADLVLLAVASSSGSNGLLPSVTQTLPQAELLHDAVVRRASDSGQVPPGELTGRDSDGKPLRQHLHTHILPLDLDRDGHLDHILFWAKQGFSREAQEAIGELRRTYTKGGKDALLLAIAGRALQAKVTDWPDGLACIIGSGRRWFSFSPFVAPRFVKKSGSNTLERQIRSELTSRGFPDPLTVKADVVPPSDVVYARLASRFRHFVRVRRRGGTAPPQDAGWYVELEFDRDVTGPICIGYGSHFGLGRMNVRL